MAKKVRELMGAKEVQELLGVRSSSNLRRVAGLPEPIADLACGSIWDGAEVRKFAEQRKARTKAAA